MIIHNAGCFGAFLMSFSWQSPALRPATEALAQAAAAAPAVKGFLRGQRSELDHHCQVARVNADLFFSYNIRL